MKNTTDDSMKTDPKTGLEHKLNSRRGGGAGDRGGEAHV